MHAVPIIRTATNIILHGGLLRIASPNSTVKYMPVNIALMRSNDWLNGTLVIDKNPYYRLMPSQNNYIEIRNINNHHFLAVNEKVIYETTNLFGYTINILLNKNITDKPFADFFKYY